MSATNLPEATAEAKIRLQKQICELGLPGELADDIIGHHTLVNYNKGAMVFLQGSPAEVLFYVITGLVKVYCPRSNGTRILIKLAGPGDLVGYADCVDARGRRAQIFEVEALTKSSVALFTREHILKILNTLERTVLLQVIERLNTAWSSMAHWFGTFLAMSFKERLEIVLNELATKFGVRESRGILLTPEMAHADFADMIGSSRPMVTRLMADMTKQGLLLRQGKRFILCDPSANGQIHESGKRAPVSPGGNPLNGASQDGSRAGSSQALARKPVGNRPRLSLAPAAHIKRIVN
jgi:CRP-like cAMP-binding protein